MVGQALNPLLNLAKNNQGFDQLKAMKSVDQTKDRWSFELVGPTWWDFMYSLFSRNRHIWGNPSSSEGYDCTEPCVIQQLGEIYTQFSEVGWRNWWQEPSFICLIVLVIFVHFPWGPQLSPCRSIVFKLSFQLVFILMNNLLCSV